MYMASVCVQVEVTSAPLETPSKLHFLISDLKGWENKVNIELGIILTQVSNSSTVLCVCVILN